MYDKISEEEDRIGKRMILQFLGGWKEKCPQDTRKYLGFTILGIKINEEI